MTLLALTLLFACADLSGDSGPVTDGGPVTGPGDTGWPEDTDEEEGTDEDGDGWTVEEGDCDDDNIYVHPGWEEDPDDGVDNDCDGRLDEDFSGLVVIQVWYDGSPNVLHHIDTLGKVSRTVTIDDPELYPFFLTWGAAGGYAVMDLGAYTVVAIDDDGTSTLLADFLPEAEKGEILGFYGMTTHPDGHYLVACGNRLYAVDPGGAGKTLLAEWDADKELYTFDVAIDPLSGEVGLFGYYGGFATWDGAALDLRISGGAANYDGSMVIYSGAHRDGGGWYAGAFTADGWEMFRLEESAEVWVSQFVFDSQWVPTFFTIDGDSGDYYLAANAASYPTVWRVSASSGAQDLFYESELTGSTNDTEVWDIYTLY